MLKGIISKSIKIRGQPVANPLLYTKCRQNGIAARTPGRFLPTPISPPETNGRRRHRLPSRPKTPNQTPNLTLIPFVYRFRPGQNKTQKHQTATDPKSQPWSHPSPGYPLRNL